MHTLTVKIPDDLDAALVAESRQRGVSKSAVVRDALEASLGRHAEVAGTAERWVAEWRGALVADSAVGRRKAQMASRDDRVAQILRKHVK